MFLDGRMDKLSFTMSSSRSYLEIQVNLFIYLGWVGGSILNGNDHTSTIEDLATERVGSIV